MNNFYGYEERRIGKTVPVNEIPPELRKKLKEQKHKGARKMRLFRGT